MQSTIHRSYEALALIGVTSAVLLLGCDAGATRAAPTLDALPTEVVLAWHSSAQEASVEPHDPLNVIQPAFTSAVSAESSAQSPRSQGAPSHEIAAVLFPAQIASSESRLAAEVHATAPVAASRRADAGVGRIGS